MNTTQDLGMASLYAKYNGYTVSDIYTYFISHVQHAGLKKFSW